MPLAVSLFADEGLDGLDGLIEATLPWFMLWLIALALVLALYASIVAVHHLRRSPVEKLLRRRFG